MKPKLKAPGTKRLKLNYDAPLSNFAFNFNFRLYTALAAAMPVPTAATTSREDADEGGIRGRGLLSSTSQLNLSRCWHKHIP
jgi:hypothetical protein